MAAQTIVVDANAIQNLFVGGRLSALGQLASSCVRALASAVTLIEAGFEGELG